MEVIQEEYSPTGEIRYAHIECFAKNMGMSESEVKKIKGSRRYGKFLVSVVGIPDGKCHSCEECFQSEQAKQVWPCRFCGNLQDPNVNWEGIPANCERCFSYICSNHGGVDAEGNIWCEICAKEHGVVLEADPIPALAVDPDGLDKQGQEAWKEYYEGTDTVERRIILEFDPNYDCDGCENGCDVCIAKQPIIYDDDVPHPFFREDYPNL